MCWFPTPLNKQVKSAEELYLEAMQKADHGGGMSLTSLHLAARVEKTLQEKRKEMNIKIGDGLIERYMR